MPSYLLHKAAYGKKPLKEWRLLLLFASYRKKVLKTQTFLRGVEAPDILKKWNKVHGTEGARAKYETIRTSQMPAFDELLPRILQKERQGSTDGLHYGLSSSPDVKAFWNGLADHQKNNPFYRGYAWHLLTDAIMYGRLNIDAKFQKFLDANQGRPDIEELRNGEVKKLHTDWDKTNARVRETYPDVSLSDEVKELGVVQFIDDGELVYVDWSVLKSTIDYLRTFDPLNGDMDAIIETVMSSI